LKMPYLMSFLVIMSVRFFPVLMEDLDDIKDVFRSRGVELDKGNYLTRIKNQITLILPLLSNSLERSIQVAEALESRAFGITKERTFFKSITLQAGDYFIISVNFIFLLILLYFRFSLNYGAYDPFPEFVMPPLAPIDIFILVFIFTSNLFLIGLLRIRRN
ncbi:MAG: energy-coupling factor transporter transmembrane component T, partial [Promethearchaeota archaeon]